MKIETGDNKYVVIFRNRTEVYIEKGVESDLLALRARSQRIMG